jgi:hypothetical protein
VTGLRKVAALVVVLGLMAVGAVSADWVMDSVLSGQLGTIDVHALVTFDGSIYTYTYEVTATGVVNPVHLFDVGNPNQLTYTAATNTGATHVFVDPTYKPFLTSVAWSNGELKFGETATFAYESEWAPTEVHTAVSGGGLSSDGLTLGMVPEPTSVSLFGLCALGALGLIQRRRRA